MDSNERLERTKQRLRAMTVERGCTPAEASAAAAKLAQLEFKTLNRRIDSLLNASVLSMDELSKFLPNYLVVDGVAVLLKKIPVKTLKSLLEFVTRAENPGIYEKCRAAQIRHELNRRNKKNAH